MDDKKRKTEIFYAFRNAALLIGADVTKERLQAYTENAARDFQNKPLGEVKQFLNELGRTCKFFPSYAEILERAKGGATERDEATLLAGEILDAVSRFGQYQGREAMEYLGELRWQIVIRSGGWHSLCSITNDELPTVRAQLRDLGVSVLKKQKAGELLELGAERLAAAPTGLLK